MKKKTYKRIAALIICAVMLFSSFPLTVYSSEQANNTGITVKIADNRQYLQISVRLSDELVLSLGEEKLSLFEIPPQSSGVPLSQLTAVKTDIVPKREASISLAVENNLYSAFVLAAQNDNGGYSEICSRAYITNYEVLSDRQYEYPAVATKKGLDFTLFSDAQLLGVGHTVLNFPINEYLCSYSENVIAYQYKNGTYYFDSSKIALLDYKVKVYSDAGIRVYLDLLLTEKTDSTPEALSCLYYPQAPQTAEYYAVNTDSSDAVGYLSAVVNFLMSRYTKPTRENGFCGSIIFGYEVNSNRNTNASGNRALSEYTAGYAKAYRIIDGAARSVYANARVYVPLSDNFTKPSDNAQADATLDYSARDFLDTFASVISVGGELPWRVSVNPYDLSGTGTVFTQNTQNAEEPEIISMANIEQFTRYLSLPQFLYKGQRRSVIIGELAYSAVGNTDSAQKLQAASFVYAYFKAEANEMIEAVIWKAQVDSSKDEYNCGLWTREAGTNNAPNGKKEIYNVFKYIDTDSSRAVCEPYLTVTGFSFWGEAIIGYNPSGQVKRTVVTSTGTASVQDEELYSKTLFGFGEDAEGFFPTDNAAGLSVGNDTDVEEKYGSSEILTFTAAAAPFCEYRGISNVPVNALDLNGTKYLKVSLKLLSGQAGDISDLMLRLSGVDSNGLVVIYEGNYQLVAGEFYDICFDISEYLRSVDGKVTAVRLWVRPYEENNDIKGFMLHNISALSSTHTNSPGNTVKVVFIVIGSIILIIALVLLVLYVRAVITDKKRKKRRDAKKRNI